MIHIKFFRLDIGEKPGGKGRPAEIDVQTNLVEDAYKAACDSRADYTRKMRFTYVSNS